MRGLSPKREGEKELLRVSALEGWHPYRARPLLGAVFGALVVLRRYPDNAFAMPAFSGGYFSALSGSSFSALAC
jgi:hypothetical protein